MNSFFESNLSALSRVDPELADRMRALPWPQPGLTILPARTGAPTLKAVGQDGIELLLHSEYDPVREARQFLEVRKLENHSAYLLNGFGLGYVALAAAAQLKPRKWMACVEAQEGLFRGALEAVDLIPLITRPRVRFFIGKEWAVFQNWIKSFLNDSAATDLSVIEFPPGLRLFPEFYGEVSREVGIGANYTRLDWNTLIRYGKDLDRNALRNLPSSIRSLGVKDFEGLFSGIPGIVVGAGPSLNTAIPHLQRARGRCVIVAVGRALKRLIKEDVVPQFVVSLDMVKEVMAFFRGFDIPPGIGHLFDMDSYYEAPASFPGPNITYHAHDYFSRWCRNFLGDRGSLEKGNTVAHCAFQFAHSMGCRPIMLVGVDLAFPGENTHADGVPQSWGGKTKDLDLDWVTIPGSQGQPVRSDVSFASYVTGFEIQIVKNKASVIQTSEIGAFIRGAEHRPLSEALDRFAPPQAPIEEKLRAAFSKPNSFDANAFKSCTDRLQKGLESLLARSEAVLHVLSQVRKMDPANRLDQAEIFRKLTKIEEEETEVIRDPDAFPFMGRLLASADREIRTTGKQLDELALDDPERLRVYTRMFESSFNGVRDAAAFLLEELRPVREQILRDPPWPPSPQS
jgi:hypothetical protein